MPDEGTAREETLDTSGLHCPMPVLLVKRRLRRMAPGARLTVQATDPLAELDLANFCREEGHVLLSVGKDADRVTVRIERGRSGGL
ncbi:MAG: sulfurtransferase TusA family protein [Parvibaculaceae bacterium]|nr:sulfurtransferase TusA family protein [Parvibaculaceae bacterium]